MDLRSRVEGRGLRVKGPVFKVQDWMMDDLVEGLGRRI